MIATNPIHEVCDYGSSAVYCSCPSPEQVASGVVPLDSLPAAWWNWMWNDTNKAVNQARQAVGILIDEVDSVLANAGVCVNPNCVDQLYQAINKIRSTIGNAVTAGAVKSSSCGGQVTIEDDGTMTMNGVGNAANLTTTAHTVVGAINELKTTYDCCVSDLSTCIGTVDNSKAPTNHASANATYGVGNASCYGHVMLSDEYTSCVGAAADGVAASQMAVYCLYTAIGNAASLGNTVACLESAGGSIGICATAARSDHRHPYPRHIRTFAPYWCTFLSSDYTWDGGIFGWNGSVSNAWCCVCCTNTRAERGTVRWTCAFSREGLLAIVCPEEHICGTLCFNTPVFALYPYLASLLKCGSTWDQHVGWCLSVTDDIKYDVSTSLTLCSRCGSINCSMCCTLDKDHPWNYTSPRCITVGGTTMDTCYACATVAVCIYRDIHTGCYGTRSCPGEDVRLCQALATACKPQEWI